jgi:spore germination protein KB
MMLESGKISPGQAGFIMIFTVLGTANLIMPAQTSRYAHMDAWLTTIVSILPHIVLILAVYRIGNTFPRENMVRYIRKITGKYLGVLIILGYIWYLMFSLAMILRTVAEFLLTAFMPDTPIEVFIIVILLLGALAVKAGLEVLVRAATFIAPIFLASFALTLALLAGELNLSSLSPVMEHGLKPVIYGSFFPTLWRGEFILMLFIWPSLNKPEQGLKSMLITAAVITLIMLPITAVTTSVFGPLTSYMHFPTYALVKYIDLAGFITRLDAVFMAVWIAGVFVKVGIFYYCLSLLVSLFLGLKEYRCTVYPLGIILGALVIIIAPNMAVFVNAFPRVVVPLYLLFEYLVPMVMVGLLYLKGLPGAKRGETDGIKQVERKN